MNKNLVEIIKLYSTKTHKDYANQLLDYSKDTLIALFSDLLTLYINDKNSSTIREFLTLIVAGYEHNTEKLSFNGFKQNSFGKAINGEVKPQNFRSEEFKEFLQNKRKSIKKLNVSDNFTDFTWNRFEKHKTSNLNMLFSGFVDGKLIYILELPYNDKLFLARLKTQLQKRFPKGDIKGEYLRSANFSFAHFKDSKNLKVVYQTENIKQYQGYINKDLFAFLGVCDD